MKKIVGVLLVAVTIFYASAVNAQEKISMDFANVDITVVIKYISDLTGKNFIIDDKVRGSVTIVSPKKVTKREAYKVFESILEVYGFTAISSGSVTKIVPIAEGRQKAGTVEVGDSVLGETRDSMITQLIPLKFLSAAHVVNLLRPLMPPTSFITSYAASNTVILVENSSNLKRILTIVKELDVEGKENQIVVRRLEYASAKNIAKKITSLLTASATKTGKVKSAQPLKVLADDRINAIIISGNEAQINRVDSLVEKLDVEVPPGRASINVVYLKNAVAVDLAKVINRFVASSNKKSAGKGAKAASMQIARDDVVVTADKATNSLLITSSPEDFEMIKKVIDKLDIRRRQVFVEALIFEISSDDTQKFGVEWRTTSNFNESGAQGFGGTNLGSINSVAADPFSATGLVLGVVDGLVSFKGITYANIGGLVTALHAEIGVNILSTPNILTTDNEEAEIFVGENVPFIKSTAQTTAGAPIESIERQDVGIILRITPQINEDDMVKLSIFQEISSVKPTIVGDKAKDIITSKRTVKTTVVVKNNQNIIIGGLIRDDFQDTIIKVPILGDIPILGWLFKRKEKVRTKTNLLIFLTPHIINSMQDIDDITKERKGFMNKLKKEIEGGKSEPQGEEKNKELEKAKELDAIKQEVLENGEEITLFGSKSKKPSSWVRNRAERRAVK